MTLTNLTVCGLPVVASPDFPLDTIAIVSRDQVHVSTITAAGIEQHTVSIDEFVQEAKDELIRLGAW